MGARRRRLEPGADRQCSSPVRRDAERDDRCPHARIAALDNRIPSPVLWLQILASALALGVLGMFLASHERGVLMALLAAGLVAVMLLVIFDLDRPHRGMITIPDGPIVAVRESMNAPPAAAAPP